ncbi:MAG: translation initiation factor [Planctomycetia bacterium]|nr:translation initiation factor [Planctomycetia bacterium]
MMKDKIVFSTDPNYSIRNESNQESELEKSEKQDLRIWLEKRPRNKIVSIIRGFVGKEDELKDLSKLMKKKCGIGGSIKAGEIIIQTKDRQKLLQILNDLGYFAKLSGG